VEQGSTSLKADMAASGDIFKTMLIPLHVKITVSITEKQ
jgi:hypothetical protein